MDVLRLGSQNADRVVLFAAGRGGDPERHRPLLERLAGNGCHVVAPYFDLLPADAPAPQLLERLHGLVAALEESAHPDAEVVAIGHSIGGWAALCLAGATPWGWQPIEVPREPRIGKLVLYAPAAGWFAAPGALAEVKAPMLVYAGGADTVTPVAQASLLRGAAGPVDLRVVPGAGHFGFMHTPPPGMADDPAFDREGFLVTMVDETLDFILR